MIDDRGADGPATGPRRPQDWPAPHAGTSRPASASPALAPFAAVLQIIVGAMSVAYSVLGSLAVYALAGLNTDGSGPESAEFLPAVLPAALGLGQILLGVGTLRGWRGSRVASLILMGPGTLLWLLSPWEINPIVGMLIVVDLVTFALLAAAALAPHPQTVQRNELL